MRGDAKIVLVEARGEGVLRLAYRAVGAVDAHYLHQVIGELALLPNGVVLMQEPVFDLFLFAYPVDERHERRLDPGEILVEHVLSEAFLELVEPVIVGIHIGSGVFGKTDVEIDELFKIRLKQRVVGIDLRVMPYGGRLGLYALVFHEFIHGYVPQKL